MNESTNHELINNEPPFNVEKMQEKSEKGIEELLDGIDSILKERSKLNPADAESLEALKTRLDDPRQNLTETLRDFRTAINKISIPDSEAELIKKINELETNLNYYENAVQAVLN